MRLVIILAQLVTCVALLAASALFLWGGIYLVATIDTYPGPPKAAYGLAVFLWLVAAVTFFVFCMILNWAINPDGRAWTRRDR